MTISTIGNGTRTYTSIQSWEDAAPATLTDVWEGQLYPEGPGTNGEWTFSTTLLFSGSVSSATNFKRLTCASGQSFRDSANKLTNALRYNPANGVAIRSTGMYANVRSITVSESYAEFVGLQISATAAGSERALHAGNPCTLKHCIVENQGSGMVMLGAYTVITAVDCVLVSKGTAPIVQGNSATQDLIGCTILRIPATADAAFVGSPKLTNCTLFGSGSASIAATSSYNATDLASLSGANNQTSLTTSAQFENVASAATLDLRVKSGNGIATLGTNAAAMGGVDILGQTRATSATIGAFEVTASAVTHSTSGTLTSSSATLSGSSSRSGAAVTHSVSGSLIASASALSGSAAKSGYGVRIAIIGDSIASGRGGNNQIAATSGAFLYDNAGSVVTLADPWDGGTNTYAALDDGASAMGSFAPRISVKYQNAGISTLLIPANKGGTQTLDWARSTNTATCYGAMKARLDASGVDKIVIILGANDAMSSVSQATFASRMNQLGADLASDYPAAQIYLVKVHHFSGYTTQIDAIRAGVDDVWAGTSGLLRGGDLDGTSSGVHPSSDGELTAGADVIYAAISAVTHSVIGDLSASSATLSGSASRAGAYVKSASVTLSTSSGAAIPNLTGLKWAWFDQITPDLFSSPTDKGVGEITDGSGVLTVNIPASSKSSGQTGWLMVTDSDGTTTQSPSHKAFSGPVLVN